MASRRSIDAHLLDALTKAYTARAKLFHNGVQASQIDLLIAEIDAIPAGSLRWPFSKLGVTRSALGRVKRSGANPQQVFAHPDVVATRPHLIAYYRNIATISRKGIAQILFATEKYEERRATALPPEQAKRLCRTLNTILSAVIDSMPAYNIAISRKAILAEIGAQLQGRWANSVGQGAAKAVEKVIADYLGAEQIGTRIRSGQYSLTNGWAIAFRSEPDVTFTDKSFRKQLAENPRCHTIYLASCFTEAVIGQIKADGQVRDWYNLTSILGDEAERHRFLRQVFHVVRTPG